MDGLTSEKTIKNDFHFAAFRHWPKVFGQGKGWKPTLWWPLNWQHTLSQTSIMQLHIISVEFLTTFAHTFFALWSIQKMLTLVCVIGLPWKKAGALNLKIWHTQVQGLLHSKKCTRLRQWMRHRHYPLSVHNSDRARSKRMCGRPSENHVARPHTQSVQQESLWLWLHYKSSVLGLVGPPACTIFSPPPC